MSYNIEQTVWMCNTLWCMSSHSQIRCNIICKIYRLYIRFTGCQMFVIMVSYATGTIANGGVGFWNAQECRIITFERGNNVGFQVYFILNC